MVNVGASAIAIYGLQQAYVYLVKGGPAAAAACSQTDCVNGARNTTYVVYHSIENGVTRYVGITTNFARRAAEHLVDPGRVIARIPKLEGLTKFEAHAVEQVLIERHGLSHLDNIINSIATSNPNYQQSIEVGKEILSRVGF